MYIPRIAKALFYRPRLSSSILVSILFCYILLPYVRYTQAILAAFDLGATIFLVSIMVNMSRATSETMLRRARQQNEGKWAILALSTILVGVIMLAVHLELHAGKENALLRVVFAALSIFLSWLFLATSFALQYAHNFALNHDKQDRGLLFPGTKNPDYWDFMYFSLILSMAFQTSDVQISDSKIRRLALIHSVISFFFNVVILAITINVLGGVL